MDIINFLKSKTFLKNLLIAGVGLIVFVFAVMKWLDFTTNHNQKIEVPDLSKLSLNEVIETLDELDLNFIVIDSASYNPNFPKKSVIDQDPLAGEFVKENRKVYLTLNPSGYKNIEVPNLLGRTKRQASSHLQAIGFKIHPTPVYVSDIAKDVVRGLIFNNETIKQGTKLPKNSVIKLRLGDGNGKGRYIQKDDSQD
jgi:beta-lactam-binding protein with PASTA domain